MRCKTTFASMLLAFASVGFAGRAPVDQGWRSLGMGGAGVAVVDDLEAVHLNPAGLTQLGVKGSFRPLDTLGYDRNPLDIQLLGLGIDPSADNLLDFKRFWSRNQSTIDSATDVNPIALAKNQNLLDDLYQFDRKPLPVNIRAEMGGAFQNWGMALWSNGEATLQMDHGAITPKALLRVTSTSALELATAQAFLEDRLSLGFGYRVVARSHEWREYDIIELNTEGTGAATKMLQRTSGKLHRVAQWGHGFDVGALWFQSPGLRFGGSLRGVGMKLEDQLTTPNLTVGTAWSPKRLQSDGLWSRRVNVCAALEDLLYDSLGYKPLSKIDIGAEWMQTLVPHVVELGLSVGLKGGYPTFLVSGSFVDVVRLDLLSYGEESGYFTGDRENRVWMLRVGVGL
jgi:hypothetical protein